MQLHLKRKGREGVDVKGRGRGGEERKGNTMQANMSSRSKLKAISLGKQKENKDLEIKSDVLTLSF